MNKPTAGVVAMQMTQLTKTTPAADAVAQRVITLVSEQTMHPEGMISPDKRISYDLGADSLDAVELVMALENEFHIEIDDQEWAAVVTVQQAIDLVNKQLIKSSARR